MLSKCWIPKTVMAIVMASHSIDLLASAAAVTPMQALGVLERSDTSCANKSWTPCTNTDRQVFSFFCCGSDDMCLSLDHSFSTICCRKGEDCSGIGTIPCEIQNYNVSANPYTPFHTVRLHDALPRCQNDQCCPFGYTCGMINGGKTVGCSINKNSTIFPAGYPGSAASSSTSSSPTSSTSSKSSASATPNPTTSASAAQGIDSNTKQPHPSTSRFPSGAVGLGLGLGLFFGALLTLAAIILFGCYRRSKGDRNSAASTDPSRPQTGSTLYSGPRSKFGVSSPIPMALAARTDFLRRDTSSRLHRTGTKVKSWFSSASSPRHPPPMEPMPTYDPKKYHEDPTNPASHWKGLESPPHNNNTSLAAGAIPLATFPNSHPTRESALTAPPSPIHDHERRHHSDSDDNNPFNSIPHTPSPTSPHPSFPSHSPTSTSGPLTPRTLHRPDSAVETESIKIYTPPSMLPHPHPPLHNIDTISAGRGVRSPSGGLNTLPQRAFESPGAAPKPLFAEITGRGGGNGALGPQHPHPHPAFLDMDPMAGQGQGQGQGQGGKERPNTTFTDIMQRAGFEGRR